jgi:probable rRNA maturation factor
MPTPPVSDHKSEDAPDPEPDPGLSAGPQVLTLDIVHEADGWSAIPDIESLIQAAVNALTAEVDLGSAQSSATVLLTSDAEVRLLNAKWRGIDQATNVLSFPAAVPPGDLETVDVLGDIALACETVLREAADQGTSPAHHLQHLVVHGLLHLAGYDHELPDEATEMETLEIDILARIGVPNPYAGTELA